MQATTTEGESLIGAFSSDCQPTIPQLQVEWAADEKVAQLPSCIVPGFSQLYVIPENCSGFNDRVPAACNVQLEDILLVRLFFPFPSLQSLAQPASPSSFPLLCSFLLPCTWLDRHAATRCLGVELMSVMHCRPLHTMPMGS